MFSVMLVMQVHNTTQHCPIIQKTVVHRVQPVQPKFNKEENMSSYKQLSELVRQGGKYLNKKLTRKELQMLDAAAIHMKFKMNVKCDTPNAAFNISDPLYKKYRLR